MTHALLQTSQTVLDSASQSCELCLRYKKVNVPGSPECKLLQQMRGCHACGITGCWIENRNCTFVGRSRVAHIDGTLGNNVPHFRGELNIRVLDNENPVKMSRTILPADWWLWQNVVIEIDGDRYRMGSASGNGCNCLIDTLRQALDVVCNVDQIRHLLHQKYAKLREGEKRLFVLST